MNTKEAYKIFELNESASIEEVKKKHKELVKKYHPDLNPNNLEKMKQVNEAFEVIKNKSNKPIGFSRIDLPEEITLYKTISFAEAVYGGKVKLEYSRTKHCDKCEGEGVVNNCTECNGRGVISKTQVKGNTTFIQQEPCRKCTESNLQNCNSCNGSGSIQDSVSINVKIPPGIKSGAMLVLNNMGNFGIMRNIFGFSKQYTNANLIVTYENNTDFKIIDDMLNLDINLTYLESLEGFSKTIKLPNDEEYNLKSDKQIINPTDFIKGKGIGNGNLVINYKIQEIPKDKLGKIIEILKE